MNSDQRERSYGELRDAVIEVMLDAGDDGMNSFGGLIEKTDIELHRRDSLGAPRQHLGSGGWGELRERDSELVLEIIWDLARRGTLTFDPDASNPSWLSLRRSRFAEHAIRHGAARLENNARFMKALRLESADISPDSVVYLKEAVAAFYMDCLLSACVMLSIAAEGEFLRLLNVAKNSRTHGASFAHIGESQDIGGKFAQFKEALRPIARELPKAATDELDNNFDAAQSVIRAVRKKSGQPWGVLPPSRERVYLYLQLFIPFAKQVNRLRCELNEPLCRRIVPLH